MPVDAVENTIGAGLYFQRRAGTGLSEFIPVPVDGVVIQSKPDEEGVIDDEFLRRLLGVLP